MTQTNFNATSFWNDPQLAGLFLSNCQTLKVPIVISTSADSYQHKCR
ncbi:hypothetical protein M2133_000985 [Parabacteroides sp. PF5-6]|nr:hypothetical protein [Parabacteroides sp. PF5-6]